MKTHSYYLLTLLYVMFIMACGGTHDHSHDHAEHEHHHHEHNGHTHDHEDCGHVHDHSHEAHEHGTASSSGHSNEETISANIITFSKEQQSKIDFAVEKVVTSAFNGAVKVAARVAPTPDNYITVVATSAGRLRFAGNVVAGKEVHQGEPLFFLDGSNVTDNDVAVKFAAAESNWQVAKADYERKSLLYKENIVSLKELQISEAAMKQAEAHYNSMKRSYNGGKMVLKAPMSGCISSLLAENGSYVEPGTPVAAIERDGDVNIEAELPVRFANSLSNISSVNIELSDGRVIASDEVQGRLVAVGRVANECNMVPVTVATKRIEGIIPGSIVTLHLAMSSENGTAMPVISRNALVEEMGNFFVFVQKGDVSFEKREVHIGATDGKRTQVTKGLKPGETVVVKGAVSLKLSQGAAAIDPHAGHVH